MQQQQTANYGPLAAYLSRTHESIAAHSYTGGRTPPPPPPDVLSTLQHLDTLAMRQAATAIAPMLNSPPLQVLNSIEYLQEYFVPRPKREVQEAPPPPQTPPDYPPNQQRASLGRILTLSLGEILGTAHLAADLYYDLRRADPTPLTDEEQAVSAQLRRIGWRPWDERAPSFE